MLLNALGTTVKHSLCSLSLTFGLVVTI